MRAQRARKGLVYSKHRTLIFIAQHIPQALDNPNLNNPLKRDKKN